MQKKGPGGEHLLGMSKISKEWGLEKGSREEHRGRDRTVSRAQRQQKRLGPGGSRPTPVTEGHTSPEGLDFSSASAVRL